MLRPSLPMMRPFISSLGMATEDWVVSTVVSAAQRWMAWATIQRERLPASSLVWLSISRTRAAASRRASASIEATSSTRASSALSPAIRSSSPRRSCPRRSASRADRLQLLLLLHQGLIPLLQILQLALELLLPLRQALLLALHLRPALPGVLLRSGLEPDRLLFGLQDQLFLPRPRFLQDALGVRLGHARLLRVGAPGQVVPRGEGHRRGDE